MTNDQKLDLILKEVSEIKTSVAVEKTHRQVVNARMKNVEEDIDKVKTSQNKMVGQASMISLIFTAIGSFLTTLFFKHS